MKKMIMISFLLLFFIFNDFDVICGENYKTDKKNDNRIILKANKKPDKNKNNNNHDFDYKSCNNEKTKGCQIKELIKKNKENKLP